MEVSMAGSFQVVDRKGAGWGRRDASAAAELSFRGFMAGENRPKGA
jgi:hypothetical protein